MNVLTVDYQSPEAPALFCKSLRETGFAVLTNHPIAATLIERAYAEWRDFFQSEHKQNFLYRKPSQAGYFPFRTEHAKDTSIADLKEFYHYYPGAPQPQTTRETSAELYQLLGQMAAVLLDWIENHLPPQVASKLSMPLRNMIIDSPNTMLRILHYPPLSGEIEPGAVRGAAHEDINLLTLLPAATAPGLEVKDVHGNWHAVPCDPGSVVVNIADMLQMCTEYYFKSTTHRVVNPDDDQKHHSRYSMPLFLHARPDVLLTNELTAEAYLHQRLRAIGIY